MKNPIIVALDVGPEEALSLAEKLKGVVGGVKIGSALFTAAGPEIVRAVRRTGVSVFLDLKWHDIPNTVALAVANAVKHLDVQMLNVHTSGGVEMMQAAVKSAQETAQALGKEPPLVLGVTVLTSLNFQNLEQMGFQSNSVSVLATRLTQLAVYAKLDGLICSPLEVDSLRQIIPPTMQLVTPGIRGIGDAKGDQKRTLSAREAMDAGANWLVIGRPIYAALDPVKAAEAILATLN